MTEAKDLLARIGLDVDEVVQEDMDSKNRRREVCKCGHPMSYHSMDNGVTSCVVSKMYCPCKRGDAILVVEDLRMFKRKTEGSGALHALSRGIAAMAAKGKSAQWIEEKLICSRCKTDGIGLTICAVTKRGSLASEATGYDALLCDECRSTI